MSATSSGSARAGSSLVVRWSLRDLRARWLQVAAIAIVIALGTGSYAGLSSVTRWRRISTDAGYDALRMYDIRVHLAENTKAPAGSLAAGAREIAPDDINAADERLIGNIQVDASAGDQAILVPGAIYGVPVDAAPHVNALDAAQGRALAPDDAGGDVAMLERNFAKHYGLPPTGTITVSGGRRLAYVGQAMTPEFFVVTSERGDLLAEANFAAVFTSLETAQRLLGAPGMVNDLVVTLREGADIEAVRQRLEDGLRSALPGVAAEVTTRDEDPAFRLNDRDIEGDQQVYDVLAALIFAGAVGAAFNLTARVVESQRREIGIAMALGVSPWRIAVRPMLMGAEIALLGVLVGAGVGYGLGQLMMTFVRDVQPLPEWRTPFQWRLFGVVAGMGFVLPLVATAWPVWRAVSVPPIAAIRPAYRAAASRVVPSLRFLRLPGRTFAQLPVRNIVRAPRRALLTALGIAAALAALIAFVGMIDSFIETTHRGDAELLGGSPGRLDVGFGRFFPADAPQVRAVLESPLVAEGEAGARLGGTLRHKGHELEAEVHLIDVDSAIWKPTLIAGSRDRSTPGIYLSELAAKQLGVRIGETVALEHPKVDATGAITAVRDELPVLGVHPHPLRFVTYIDTNHYALFAPAPFANEATVIPAPGVSADEVKRALFVMDGVSSIQQVGATAKAIRDFLDQFVVVLRVVEGAMLLIALLIAFNSSSISMDERAREHATMFAFGVPVGTVVRMAMVESLILGVLATAGGVGLGWVLLRILLATRVAATLPDIYIKATIGTTTLLIAAGLGMLVVSAAPVLHWRRLARTDVPATLKVME